MLGFNDEFKNGKTRVTKAWLDITLSDSTVLNLDESRVMFNGLTRDTSTTMDGEFTVGAAVTAKLTVSLDNSDNALDAYDFRGAVIVAWLGGTLTSGTVQKVNIGRYNVSEYSYDGSNVNLVALDDLCKFDVQCTQTMTWASGKTIANLVNLACSAAGISLYNNSLPGPANYTVALMPEQWETMTWHDVISYCAQLMGCYAHMVYVPNPGTWKLKFDWYDMGPLSPSQFDGGTYNTTTTPYSDGATLDGGSFNPWNTGDVADGGTFHDRDNVIILPSPYDMTVDTDDVMITGVTVTLDSSDNINADDDTKTYTTDIVGSAGYVINIEGNPLIETTAQADIVAAYLGALINGMRFRPMTVSAIEDPSLEAGDTALITDRNGNTYAIFLSHVTYTVNASTQISCDAQSTMQNLKSRFSGAQKTRAMIQRTVEKTASDAENAMSGIIGALATTMGLYKFEETAPDGGTIYKFGDAQTLAQSTKIWRFSAGALTVSNDGGTTWSAALSADGIAVLQALYAVKVNADLIEAGAFTTKDSRGNETFYADTATGTVRINAQSVSITGRSVDSIAEGYADTAESNAKTAAQGYASAAQTAAETTAAADATVKANAAEGNAKTYSDGQLNAFKNGDYATFATNTTNAINGKITTYYQASAPTTHNTGDLWIDTDDSNKLYRWSGSQWVSVRDAGIAAAIGAAADAQETADGKIITFAQTSAPTATDVGDLWIDTDDNNKLYRWSGSQWVAYSDSSALNSWITSTYSSDKSTLQNQIDEKIETWYQASDPSSSWSDSTTKAKHIGDLWYCSASTGTYAGKYWQYTYESNAYSWKELKAMPPTGVMDEIDGKANIFTGSTTPSGAEEGDLWFKGTNQPILTYVNGSWVEYNKYTDNTVANSALDRASAKYATCSTSASTAAKTTGSTPSGFTLYTGAKVTVKFTYANTAASPTLNVNGTGAKSIYVRNSAITAKDYWKANAIVDFIYDGAYWQMCNVESQQEIFNRLTATDNGNQQGIYLDNGKLYLNFEYAQGQTLVLGGSNNTSGLLEVYDGSTPKVKIVTIDNDGIRNGKTAVTDLQNSGFCLNNDGIVVGTGSNYFQALSTGEIHVWDWPYQNGYDTIHTTFDIASIGGTSNFGSIYCYMSGDLDVEGSFTANEKLRVMDTDYGRVSLYCYETPEPSFGDIGEGVIGEDGKCFVEIDPIFSETINCKQYQVFIQPYCDDRLYVSERNEYYFVVNGQPGSTFGWELKARQIDLKNKRLDPYDIRNDNLPELYDELNEIDPYGWVGDLFEEV